MIYNPFDAYAMRFITVWPLLYEIYLILWFLLFGIRLSLCRYWFAAYFSQFCPSVLGFWVLFGISGVSCSVSGYNSYYAGDINISGVLIKSMLFSSIYMMLICMWLELVTEEMLYYYLEWLGSLVLRGLYALLFFDPISVRFDICDFSFKMLFQSPLVRLHSARGLVMILLAVMVWSDMLLFCESRSCNFICRLCPFDWVTFWILIGKIWGMIVCI